MKNSSTRTALGVLALMALAAVLAWRIPGTVRVLEEHEASGQEAKTDAQTDAKARTKTPRAKPPPAESALRVLFVGNSYTYVNDLPGMLRELSTAAKVKRPLHSESETPGGFTLQRHVAGGRAIRRIEQGRWDVIVLQDQSQRPSFATRQVEREVYPFARKLDAAARKAQAKTVFFLTWGRKTGDLANARDDTFERMQARLDRGYGRIAKELKASIAPVGRAWRLAVRARPGLELWSGDGSHPSVSGTYLAACVFFEVLYPRSVLLNPFRPAGMSAVDAGFLQEMAHRAKADWKAKGWGP